MSGTRIYGLDGCRAGWSVAWSDPNGGEVGWGVFYSAAETIFGPPEARMMAIDIPIGLPVTGARDCDIQARRRLRNGKGIGRSASVFAAPLRPVLAARDYHEAGCIRQGIDGKKMSKQAWLITPKIRELDDLLRHTPELQNRVHEAHPELCFAEMNGGRPLQFGKKRPEGFAERFTLLKDRYGQAVESALLARKGQGCTPDDVLDAFAVLWTAGRILRGEAYTLPAEPQVDAYGLRMEMVV